MKQLKERKCPSIQDYFEAVKEAFLITVSLPHFCYSGIKYAQNLDKRSEFNKRKSYERIGNAVGGVVGGNLAMVQMVFYLYEGLEKRHPELLLIPIVTNSLDVIIHKIKENSLESKVNISK